MFAVMVVYNGLHNALQLWEKFADDMSEDFMHSERQVRLPSVPICPILSDLI